MPLFPGARNVRVSLPVISVLITMASIIAIVSMRYGTVQVWQTIVSHVPSGIKTVDASTSSSLIETAIVVPEGLRRGRFSQARYLRVPENFSVSVFALVDGARALHYAPWGEWLVSLPTQGSIIGLRDTDGDGTADQTRTVLSGLRCPYGLAIRDDTLFVAQSTSIARFNHLWGEGTPVPSGVVVDGLPDSGCGAHHFRPLAIDPAGAFYIAFGSSCNVCIEADTRRSTVWKYAVDGTGREFARGLRNVVDLSFDPASGMLWAATNERDALGDDIPPEPVTPVNEGADYGWPYCYWNGDSWQVDARVPSRNPRCEGLTRYFGVQAHSAPLGITFPVGTGLPETFRGNGFASYHGSWNRSIATGYKVARVITNEGRPVASEDFVTGWNIGPRGPGDAWGRPVDIQEGPDGSLFLTDDVAGAVYRIAYTPPAQ
ncbi:MAG: sorbosone dehydrogenase family protein [Chloroflexi bacterium]|nr:MAG: sorbosone dehydrogenase family protein [Chloroflexota bacterium]